MKKRKEKKDKKNSNVDILESDRQRCEQNTIDRGQQDNSSDQFMMNLLN